MFIIGLAVVGLLTFLAVGWTVSVVRLSREARLLKDQVNFFFTVQTGEQGTAFNQAINDMGDVFATKYGQAMMAAMRGQMGGQARALTTELEDVARAENPQLALLDMLPKSLKKNPVAMTGLNVLLQRVMAGQQASGSVTTPGGNHGQVKFNL